jgi:hypothetical protein
MTRPLRGGLALALVIALPACGDGGAPTAPEKSRFVRQACALKVNAVRELALARDALKPGVTAKEFVDEEVAPIFESSLIEPLDALTPPDGDEQEVDAIIAAARKALADLKARPESIGAEEESADDPFRRFNRLTNEYGLICPSG